MAMNSITSCCIFFPNFLSHAEHTHSGITHYRKFPKGTIQWKISMGKTQIRDREIKIAEPFASQSILDSKGITEANADIDSESPPVPAQDVDNRMEQVTDLKETCLSSQGVSTENRNLNNTVVITSLDANNGVSNATHNSKNMKRIWKFYESQTTPTERKCYEK